MAEHVRWRRLVAGGAVAAVAVAALDGGIASWAQRAGMADAARYGGPFYSYSLSRHIVAMLLLSALTVAVATALTRRGVWPLGILVAAGITAGPMTTIAAPVHASLVSSFDDTATWWHVAVGIPQLLILLAATSWARRALPSIAEAASAPTRDHRRDAGLFAVVTMAALTLQVVTSRGIDQEPGLLPITGWALLAAGVALLVHRPAHAWLPAAALLGCSVPLGAIYLAYHRDSGWPGVAGWETFAQSPVVLSWMTPLVLLAVPTVAMAASLSIPLRAAHRPAPA